MNRRAALLAAQVLLATLVLGACAAGFSKNEPTAPPDVPGVSPPGLGTQQDGEPERLYQKISAEEAYGMLKGEGGVILLDVRTPEEYEAAHIPAALLLPVDELPARAEETLPDKDAPILIYCRSGVRSANAANILISLGYANVYDIGGIIDWPYETEP